MLDRRKFLEASLWGSGGAVVGAAASSELFGAVAAEASAAEPTCARESHLADAPRVYNVRDRLFGARGDGTRDDSAAVQQAIDAANSGGGGVVYLPVGDYPIGIDVADNVQLVCDPGTVLRAAGPRSPVRISGSHASLRNAEVIGRFRGDVREVRSSHCIDLRGSDVLLENVTCGASRYDSLYIRSNGGQITIRKSRFNPTARNTVSVVKGHDILFENCHFEQAPLYSSGRFTGLYLYDIEPNGNDEVFRVTHLRCSFRNGLRDEWGGVILDIRGQRQTGATNFSFIGCRFLNGPHVGTLVRLREASRLRGLTLVDNIFESFLLVSREVVTVTESALVGNRHLSPDRFAYNVRLDDVALVNHRGGGWKGYSITDKTVVIASNTPAL